MRAFQIGIELTGLPPERLLAELTRASITAGGITVRDGSVEMTVGLLSLNRVKRFARRLGVEVKETGSGRLAALVRSIGRRSGLLTGAVVWTAFCVIAKDYVLDIRVLTDDERIRSDVLRLLAENGCSAGTYIPDIKKAGLERMLKQQTDGVSWAGISISDSTLTVDVYENEPHPAMFFDRMPSDLVAAHDAVVERVEVFDGLLVTTVGSGVIRGDKLVSGTIPVVRKIVKEDPELGRILTEEQTEKYVRSVGRVYGSYTDVQTFTQPLAETSLVHTGDTRTIRRLKIFGVSIPLCLRQPTGYSTVSESSSAVSFFGEETPVSIETEQLERCSFSTVRYSKEQAAERTRALKRNYEQNFLADKEIRACEERLEYLGGAAVLTVTYELFGEISEEKQFFIKK